MGGTALSPSGTRLARTEMECRPISLRQKLRMQRERMQCAGLWPVVLNVLNCYQTRKFPVRSAVKTKREKESVSYKTGKPGGKRMTETKSVKALKKQLAAAIAMVCVAAVALGSSTYAWFVNNTQVTATDVTVTAQTV